MDHLPLPWDDSAHPPIEIPFLGNELFKYDDLGFLTYPRRAGVDIEQLQSEELGYSTLVKMAPFLQAWLWFGLLGETIQIGSRENRQQRVASMKSFTRHDREGRLLVSTMELHKSIVTASMKNKAPLYNDWHQTRVSVCLEVAMNFVKTVLLTPSCQSLLAENKRFIDLPNFYLVLFSIQILGETIFASRNVLFPNTRIHLPSLSTRLRPGTELVDVMLKQAGWCPLEVSRLPVDVRFRYYLSCFNQLELSEDHSDCSSDRCTQKSIEGTHIRPIHTHPHCSCEAITVSSADIESVVKSDKLPLFTFSEGPDGKRRLEMHIIALEMDNSPRYVTISHVRSAGFGNDSLSSLFYCQLLLLQNLANEICQSEISPVLFWIDTLCLPIDRSARNSALSSIRRIFHAAGKVLVLDPALFHHVVVSEQEALIRIRYSKWKKRLWTLQEGAIARTLCFRFANRIWTLDNLLSGFSTAFTTNFLERVLPEPRSIGNFWDLPSPEKLALALARFDDDIKTARMMRDGQVGDWRQPSQIPNKSKLYRILRLGYLAFPKFRYFAEMDEIERFRMVVEAVVSIYLPSKSPIDIIGSEQPTVGILARLEKINALNLESEAISEQNFD